MNEFSSSTQHLHISCELKMFELKYGHNFTDGYSKNVFLATATSSFQ